MKTSILNLTDTEGYRNAGVGAYRWGDFTGELPLPVGPVSGRVMQVLGQVPGDGNVYDHQRHQARLIRNYGRFDINHPSLVES